MLYGPHRAGMPRVYTPWRIGDDGKSFQPVRLPMAAETQVESPPSSLASSLTGVARVLVNAGKLSAKTAEELSKGARDRKASFVSAVVGANAAKPDEIAHALSTALALPLLVAMARATHDERGMDREVIEQGGEHRLEEILSIVRRTGALQATLEAAQAEAEAARQALAMLPPSSAREALLELSVRAVHRSS